MIEPMIPGAWESRGHRPIAGAGRDGLTADPEPLERAQERAGPPRQRSAPQRSVLSRLWRYIMRPTDTPPL